MYMAQYRPGTLAFQTWAQIMRRRAARSDAMMRIRRNFRSWGRRRAAYYRGRNAARGKKNK